VLQQAADKMSVSQLYGNVCATTSLANATTSLAALALRDGTDVAALALCAAVGAGGADCLRGTQQSCPDGKVLVCFDGVRVGLVPFKERARLAVLDEHKQLVGSLLGDDRAATMLRAVQVIVSALRTFVAGLRDHSSGRSIRARAEVMVRKPSFAAMCRSTSCHACTLSWLMRTGTGRSRTTAEAGVVACVGLSRFGAATTRISIWTPCWCLPLCHALALRFFSGLLTCLLLPFRCSSTHQSRPLGGRNL